jgi:xanthine dehydrogenase large subunit
MKVSDVLKHVKGESLFTDDFPEPQGTLQALIFDSIKAHAEILSIDISKALNVPGVKAVITSKDIPGENQIGNIVQDETLLAEGEVSYIGEPIAVIVADNLEAAKEAKKLIEIKYRDLEVITDPREAYEKGELIVPPIIFSSGNTEDIWDECEIVLSDKIEIGGQEHVYLETQAALAISSEDKIKIISSTQSPTAVQRATANILGVGMHKVEVDVLRLGGAFGGKEDQATPFAAMAALASVIVGAPVKLVLSRPDDMRMTGKRHPYSADFRIGAAKSGKILAYEVTYYQNSGAVADLSTAVLERSLFHTTNSYNIPNVKATGLACRTNLPPNTAFRGFGGPQGMFVIEAAIAKLADKLKKPAFEIQKMNLIKDGHRFYYGQQVENSRINICWKKAEKEFEFDKILNEVKVFNQENSQYKMGVAVMPITFGISFTSSFLNQASSLVHVYTDGTVGVSTAAIEMGQGVNEKIKVAVSRVFSINPERIILESTNTTRAANTSPTAASTGADLNGNAAIIASSNILERLKNKAAEMLGVTSADVEIIDEVVFAKGKKTELGWEKLVWESYFSRISLSSQAYYASPNIYFDRDKNKGRPFVYYVYGTAIVVAKVDGLRGTYEITDVKVVHDFGNSLHTQIDLGQAEGAIVQGIGWVTLEELVQNKDGRLLSNTFSTYKIPDIYSAPKNIEVKFLENSDNPYGPFNSKAIGEPPFMYGIGAYFAIRNAIKAFGNIAEIPFSSPLTHEKVLLALNNIAD